MVVSGFLDAKERTDQFAFDVLHKHGVFDKIIAYAPDAAFAKKRLLSRSSRYTGLLDVLEIVEGPAAEVIKAGGPLEGANSWLSFDTDSATVLEQAKAAKDFGLKHLVMVVSSEVDFSAAEAALADSDLTYTFIRTGAIVDGKEGSAPVSIGEMSTGLEAGAEVPRDEAVRIAGECFVIDTAGKKSFTLSKAGESSAAFLKSLREQGLSRQEEIASMIEGGLVEFETEFAEKEEKKKAKEEGDKEPKFQKKNEEERAAEVKMLMERGAQKMKDRQEEQLVEAAKQELRIMYVKQKYSEGGITDEEQYMADQMDTYLEDLRDRSYFDDSGVLNIIREDELDRLTEEELAELDAEIEAEEKKTPAVAGAKDE